MNNPVLFSCRFHGKFLIGLFLLFTISCKDLEEETAGSCPVSNQQTFRWQDELKSLIFESAVIVQKGGAIQDAVNAAMPGDAIYIEPGIYEESLTVDKAGIKLIGLETANGEKVILVNPGGKRRGISITKGGSNLEVRNIKFQNFTEDSPYIANQPLTKGTNHNHYSFKMSRDQLSNQIAHYRFEIPLGRHEFDVVRIHRVVREYRPFCPVNTNGEVFMVHGASQDFDDIFFTAGAIDNVNPQTSSAVYLASSGIDVWGIDLAWTLVPPETSDFNFMKGWGVERDVDHTLAAITLARLIRGLTGQGFGRLNLLGFSYGVAIAYTAAGRETRQHPILRDIKGIIPVDGLIKYDKTDPVHEQFRNTTCDVAAGIHELIARGTYERSLSDLTQFGSLALSAPGGPSPAISGLTNFQAGLFVGVIPVPNPPTPFWHFTGGHFNASNIPVGLRYTEPSRWFYLLTSLAPYMPQQAAYQTRACQCDEEDVSIDDDLGQISVPVLYLGAGGGTGTFGEYTTSLTASTDITNCTVSLQPGENRNIDYGHGDLFMANNAPGLVWEVLLQWLVNHNEHSIL